MFLFALCELDRQINYYYIGKLDKAEEYFAAMGIVNFFTSLIPIGINFISFNVLHLYTTSAYRFGQNEIISGFLSTQIMLNFLIFLFPIGLLVWQLQDICTGIKLSSLDVCEYSGNYLLYWMWGLFMET